MGNHSIFFLNFDWLTPDSQIRIFHPIFIAATKIKIRMRHTLPRFGYTLLVLFIILVQSGAQVEIIPDKPDGVYEVGETVTWTVSKSGDAPLDSLRYTIKKGGLLVIDEGLILLADSTSSIKYSFNAPGSVLLIAEWGRERNYFKRAVGGAVAGIELLNLSAPRPADFTTFWNEKLAELAEVPVNARLNADESGVTGVDYYELLMDHFRGAQIHGQLARPSEGEKFPALLIVQWAGVYPLQKNWAVDRAKDGWLVLNLHPHDLPIHSEPPFYTEQSKGDLKDYWAIGNDDRNTSYFLRMYLSCYRAAEYLAQRPDWNGETMVVMGDSQGGMQALVTAGIYPGITACMALVPAGFDMLGPEMGRKGGWPHWYEWTEGKDPVKVHEASRYFDVANFIPDIKCPVLAGVGLLDETCPPEGILAGLNQLKGPKEVLLLPKSGHQNRDGSQKPYEVRRDEVWLPALKAGKD
jgi:cephalosporin-C deacetylase-like acetyl esterase